MEKWLLKLVNDGCQKAILSWLTTIVKKMKITHYSNIFIQIGLESSEIVFSL